MNQIQVNNPTEPPSDANVHAALTGASPFFPCASSAAVAPVLEVDGGDDAELVRQAQAGETKAFDILVTRYRSRIYAMVLHMVGNDADAWDLAQDVFIKAWKALPKFEARSQFYTWIYRITHNVALDFLRKRKIEAGGVEFDDTLSSRPEPSAPTALRNAPEPDKAMENRELGDRIQLALNELSPEHRAVILLKEVDGFSYQEIADSVGCTTGTVMSRLFYARKRLQSLLADVYHAKPCTS